LAGTTTPAGHQLDGVSLAGLLLQGKALPERTVFWGYNRRYAVRQGPWKLVVNPSAGGAAKKKASAAADPELGLYDLSNDIAEATNLATAQPERVRALQAALTRWQQDVGVRGN
jgi:arylsulfatase A